MIELKIGFVGAGATGKTSVAKLLENEEPERFFPSVVRDTYKRLNVEGEEAQFNMTGEQLWHLQKEILLAKYKLDDEQQTGIFDRTPIDHMMYALYRCGNHISEREYAWLEDSVRQYTKKYDLLFFFPVYDWQGKDKFRQTNRAYRMVSQVMMLGLLNTLEFPHIHIEDMPVEDRVRFIRKMIKYKRNEIASRL